MTPPALPGVKQEQPGCPTSGRLALPVARAADPASPPRPTVLTPVTPWQPRRDARCVHFPCTVCPPLVHRMTCKPG